MENNLAAEAIDVMERVKWDADHSTVEEKADMLCGRWSLWVRDPILLGLPRQSVTETANSGGVMRGTPRAPSDMPDDVALTDRAIASMGLRHRSILRRVIHLRYERNLPLEGLASGLGVRPTEAKSTLGRALRYVWRKRQELA